MTPSAQARLGGPVDRHGRRDSGWLDPGRWAFAVATVTWLLTLWRQRPCEQTDLAQGLEPMSRLCYSDVPVLFRGTVFGQGGLPYRDLDFDQPPLVAVFTMLGRWLSALGIPVAADDAQLLQASNRFAQVNALLLFGCFLALVAAHVLMGRTSARTMASDLASRVRSSDAVFVAASPLVVAAGLINWDLLAAALVSWALLAWAVQRQRTAGVLIGLALCTRAYPVLVLLAWLLGCLRAGTLRPWGRSAASTLAVWMLVNLPLAAAVPGRWPGWVTSWLDREADLGSIWFVLSSLGVPVGGLDVLVPMLLVIVVAWITLLALLAPRRPRVGQLLLLLVLAWCMLGKVYSPQQVLWLVPLVALARPRLSDWGLWTIAELGYWWAVWGYLSGQSSPGDGSTNVVYLTSILLRLGAEAWMFTRVVRDVVQPWEDPVRRGFADDPIGGVLDHAPDAAADEQVSSPLSLILGVFVVSRLAMLTVVAAVVSTTQLSWSQALSHWDVQHFLAIARNGYADPIDRAFFPGLPLLMAGGDRIGVPMIATGILVAVVSSWVAVVALHRIGGPLAAVAWLLSPVGVFTVVGYTEAPFCAAAFWAWERARAKDWRTASLLACLACGVRISGLFLVGALGLLALTQADVAWRRRLVNGVLATVPLLVIGGYFAYLHHLTGSWTAWFEAQQAGWNRGFTMPWDAWQHTVEAARPSAWQGRELVARVFAFELVSMAVGALSTLVLLVRRRWAEAGWVGIQVVAFATSWWFMSVNRAVLLWFPLFVLVAALASRRPLEAGRRALWRGGWLLVGAGLFATQLWWTWLFASGQWAS